jgi:membrane protein YqaA with SNARE-associated domain
VRLAFSPFIAAGIFTTLVNSGGIGLLVLGVLDSSFLFAPWGNDLLMIAVTARHPHAPQMLYYAVMSTIGSVLGCLLIDMVLRPMGAKGLEKYMKPRTLAKVERRVKNKAGRSLAMTAMIPPPFPFTAFVMVASAMQYPRFRMLSIIGFTRMVRFALLGALAMRYGERIVSWSKQPGVRIALFVLVGICIVGSVYSVYGWIRRARS